MSWATAMGQCHSHGQMRMRMGCQSWSFVVLNHSRASGFGILLGPRVLGMTRMTRCWHQSWCVAGTSPPCGRPSTPPRTTQCCLHPAACVPQERFGHVLAVLMTVMAVMVVLIRRFNSFACIWTLCQSNIMKEFCSTLSCCCTYLHPFFVCNIFSIRFQFSSNNAMNVLQKEKYHLWGWAEPKIPKLSSSWDNNKKVQEASPHPHLTLTSPHLHYKRGGLRTLGGLCRDLWVLASWVLVLGSWILALGTAPIAPEGTTIKGLPGVLEAPGGGQSGSYGSWGWDLGFGGGIS